MLLKYTVLSIRPWKEISSYRFSATQLKISLKNEYKYSSHWINWKKKTIATKSPQGGHLHFKLHVRTVNVNWIFNCFSQLYVARVTAFKLIPAGLEAKLLSVNPTSSYSFESVPWIVIQLFSLKAEFYLKNALFWNYCNSSSFYLNHNKLYITGKLLAHRLWKCKFMFSIDYCNLIPDP